MEESNYAKLWPPIPSVITIITLVPNRIKLEKQRTQARGCILVPDDEQMPRNLRLSIISVQELCVFCSSPNEERVWLGRAAVFY
jgi:hypothetical protein